MIDILLSPLTAQVAEFVLLVEKVQELKQNAAIQNQYVLYSTVFPDLSVAAREVLKAAQHLSNQVHAFTLRSNPDSEYDSALTGPVLEARDKLNNSAVGILEAAQIIENSNATGNLPEFLGSCDALIDNTRSLLDGSVSLLLALDFGEKRKLMRVAYSSIDRLGLVAGVRSMRGLLVCFRGFTDEILNLMGLITTRQQETTNASLKERLTTAKEELKQCIPAFMQAMQMYVRNPAEESVMGSKQHSFGQVKKCLQSIIVMMQPSAVTEFTEDDSNSRDTTNVTFDMFNANPRPSLSGSVESIRRYLQDVAVGGTEEADDKQLGRDVETVTRDSLSVALGVRDARREDILRACDKLRTEHSVFATLLRELRETPENTSLQERLETSADQLFKDLESLDTLVRRVMLEETVTTFTDSRAPLADLISAVQSGNKDSLSEKLESFKEYAKKIKRASSFAASQSEQERRAARIQHLTQEVDQLSPKLLSAAESAFQKGESGSWEHLTFLGDEWTQRVRNLTSAVDEVVDPRDFMVVAAHNIYSYMKKCKQAFIDADTAALTTSYIAIKAHCLRILDICRDEQVNLEDDLFCRAMSVQVKRLDRGVNQLDMSVAQANLDIKNEYNETQVANACRDVCLSVKEIRQLIQGRSCRYSTNRESIDSTIDEWLETGHQPTYSPNKRQRHILATHPLSKSYSPPIDVKTKKPVQHTQSQMISTPMQTESCDVRTPDAMKSLADKDYSDIQSRASFNAKSAAWQLTSSTPDKSPVSIKTPKSSPIVCQKDSPLDVLAKNSAASPGTLTLVNGSSKQSLPMPNKSVMADNWSQTSPDIPTIVDRSHPYYLFTLPIVHLIKFIALVHEKEVEAYCTAVTARTLKIVSLSDEVVESRMFTGLPEARLLRQASHKLTSLTPQVIEEAQYVLKHSTSILNPDELEHILSLSRNWVSKLEGTLQPLEKFILPWSLVQQTILSLIDQGKRHKLERELERVNRMTNAIIEVGTACLDSPLLTDYSSEVAKDAREIDRTQIYQQLDSFIEEIKQIIAFILEGARESAVNRDDMQSQEQIAVMCLEWSTKVICILGLTDHITLGINQPSRFILGSLEENSSKVTIQAGLEDLNMFSNELKELGQCALCGCKDANVTRLIRGASRDIDRILRKATDVALAITGEEECHGLRQELEIVMRHWGIKAAIITYLVDELSIQVSGPIDQLGGIALSVGLAETREDSEEIKERLDNFTRSLSHNISQMHMVIDQIEEPVVLGIQSRIRPINANIESLQSITDSLINATISLSENSELENVHIFQHRRRQWTAQILKIIYSMDQVEDNASIGIISSIIQTLLLHGIPAMPSDSSTTTNLPLSSPSHSYVPLQLKKMASRDRTVHVHFDDATIVHETDKKPTSKLSPISPPYLSELKIFQENITQSIPASSLLRPASRLNTNIQDILSYSNTKFSRFSFDSKDQTALDSSFSSYASFTTKTLASVAFRLQQDTRLYMDEGNPFLEIAKTLSQLMYEMSDLSKIRGALANKMRIIETAKDIAYNSQQVEELANIIAELSIDKRMRSNLLYYSSSIPTLSNQLKILADVKVSMPMDIYADAMLVKNAQNLIQSVSKTIKSAEAACIRGLKSTEDPELQRTVEMANRWKRNVYQSHLKDVLNSRRSPLGLRVYPEKQDSDILSMCSTPSRASDSYEIRSARLRKDN